MFMLQSYALVWQVMFRKNIDLLRSLMAGSGGEMQMEMFSLILKYPAVWCLSI